MDRDKIKQIVADYVNGQELPNLTSRELYYVANILIKMGRIDLVKECAKIASKRLVNKGFMNCGEYGWNHRDEVPKMGISLKYGRWITSDVNKAKNYKFYEKKESPTLV